MIRKLVNITISVPLKDFGSLHYIHTQPIQPLFSYYHVYLRTASKNKKLKVVIWKNMKIFELAKSLSTSKEKIFFAIKDVANSNINLTENTEIDNLKVLQKVVNMFGFREVIVSAQKENKTIDNDAYRIHASEKAEYLVRRPPVVTIMGHVDHGKTTLLDTLRNSNVVDSEFGGITQHVGAFKVKLNELLHYENTDKMINNQKTADTENSEVVTFIDTPGHAAFSAMRSRGAQCTDIVILVVAAEDGLMPQSLESIRMAQEANVPIIVAVNKIDKICNSPEQMDKVMKSQLEKDLSLALARVGLITESSGGDVQVVPISAKKNWGLVRLMESVIVLADILGLQAWIDTKNPHLCEGVVLESVVDSTSNVGGHALIIVQNGQLRRGDIIVSGVTWARVRTLESTGVTRQKIDLANPSDPVCVTGWRNGLPLPGDIVIQLEKETRAREVIKYRQSLSQEELAAKAYNEYLRIVNPYQESYKKYINDGIEAGRRCRLHRPKWEDFMHKQSTTLESGRVIDIPYINVLIKADVEGSVEAIRNVMNTVIEQSKDQIIIKVADISLGPLSASDVERAVISECIVYTFNVPAMSASLKGLKNIRIKNFNVIYHLFNDLQEYASSKLPKVDQLEILGEAEIKEIFKVTMNKSKVNVFGCLCVHGNLHRKGTLIYRIVEKQNQSIDNKELIIISDDLKCGSLKHLKADVPTIGKGVECGILLKDKFGNSVEAEVGQIIQCYKIDEIRQHIRWNIGF